ncbi:hypothetical protein [Thauera humireducens]|uniref:hypothetical protein n=1 Tax=Thauera humireducens TaxID=1134435 RepID=UPI000B316E8B|nr:hypothetical protein [Thauera humireducens]
MARKPRADGTKFAVETAADLARPLPEPIFPLSDRAQKYWPVIVNSKRREAWTESDLFLAANLAEDYGELERLRKLMATQAPLIPGTGKRKFDKHPVLLVIDDVQSRIISTCRALQIHANATVGLVHHQREKNQAAREIAQAIEAADDDLIARPKLRAVG